VVILPITLDWTPRTRYDLGSQAAQRSRWRRSRTSDLLGGGQALHAHGYGERLSRDLDFYIPLEQDLFDRAEIQTSDHLPAALVASPVRHPAVAALLDRADLPDDAPTQSLRSDLPASGWR
jgi:hypothetical protein